MNQDNYDQIVKFLNEEEFPKDCISNSQKKRYRSYAKQFYLEGEILMKQSKNGRLNTRVVKQGETEAILFYHHDNPLGGHLGTEAMFGKIRRTLYWPQMYNDIKEYTTTCDSCQRRGGPKKNNELYPIEVSGNPFERIGIDIVGPLNPTKEGHRYIVVSIDYLTKWPEARALKEANTTNVSKFIYEDIICRHGCPRILQSDQGTHFVNEVIKELLRKFNIRQQLSTPYHPQTNGLVERFNRTLCESLAKMTHGLTDWDDLVQPTLFAARDKNNRSTGGSPFLLTYGRQARSPYSLTPDHQMTLIDRLQTIIEDVPHIRESARQTIKYTQLAMKRQYPVQQTKEFKIGDKVLRRDKTRDVSHSGKLLDKKIGPYIVVEKLINGTYRIADENGTLKKPISGDHLEHHKNCEHWIPMVVIEPLSVELQNYK